MDAKLGHQIDVKARTDEIRQNMPETYREIVAMAGRVGGKAYEVVRQAIRGEPNRFYAIERGWVVGTPFDLPQVQPELAVFILRFGCTYLVMWSPELVQEARDGAH